MKIDKNHLIFVGMVNISRFFSDKSAEKIIVLGGSGGKAFAGNTKYLYYFLQKNSNYKIYYFVKSKRLKRELISKNIGAIYAYSLKAIKLLRKAQYIIVTHGLKDIIPIKFSPRTIFVQTWHGILIKKLTTKYKETTTPKWAKLLGYKTSNKKIYDIFTTPTGTEKDKKIISQHFEIPKKS
ncbi:MAG: CDP-glycerol glycerophosphotransferase family protein [Nanoarchaeota archaeon]